MKNKLSATAAAFTITFSSLAFAQVGQSSDNFSRLSRPPPPPTAQLSPQATVEAAKQRVAADKKAGRVPDRKTLQMLLSAQSQLKDEAGMADTLEEQAADYNDPADWSEIIAITRACATRTKSGWAACCSWSAPRSRQLTPAQSVKSPASTASSAMR